MGRLRVRFSDNYVLINGKKYNKGEILEFLNYERANGITIKKRIDDNTTTTYIIKSGMDIVDIAFPKNCEENNKRYISIFEKWYQTDRNKLALKLKKAALIIGFGTLVGATTISYKDEIKNKINEICTDISDELGICFGSTKESLALNILQSEILVHSGHGKVDGQNQSLEDHMNDYCHLNETSNISSSIRKYCDAYGIEEVADEAVKLYEYYLKDDYKNATSIDLKETYKNNQKVKKQ